MGADCFGIFTCEDSRGLFSRQVSTLNVPIVMLSRSLHLGKRALRSVVTFRRCESTAQNPSALKKLDDSFARSVRVKVCGRFSRHNVLLRPWFLRYIPKGGHEIDIDYIDTRPDADPNFVKTIVILHNTPGSYYDFFKFLVTFGESYRIIVPNFPDFAYTQKSGCFWHSAEEKSEFIVDFLKHINVNKVDCLIAHSLAAYTASYLWIYANWSDYFKLGSICLLNPIGMFKLGKIERTRLSIVSNMSRSPFLLPLIPKRLLAPVRQKKRYSKPLAGSLLANPEVTVWKMLTVYLSNYKNYHLRLNALAHKKIPTLFVFSSNDKLYNANIYFDQLYELGAEAGNFDIYEQYDNELISASADRSWLKVVDFRSAGHYMFNTHSLLIHSYIGELLEKSWEEYKLIENENIVQ